MSASIEWGNVGVKKETSGDQKKKNALNAHFCHLFQPASSNSQQTLKF